MAVRYVAELWGYGLDWDTCLQSGLSNDIEVHSSPHYIPLCPALPSGAQSHLQAVAFKFKFHSYNRKLTRTRTQDILDVRCPACCAMILQR